MESKVGINNMQRFKHYISEIKSTIDPDSWEWVKSTDVWNVRQWDYDINLMIMKSALPAGKLQLWDVSFEVGFSTTMTGKGQSNIIFAWVIERVLEFMNSVKPDGIVYTANKGERSRVDAYKTMTRIVLRKLRDYDRVDIGEGGGKGYPFYLVKKNKIDSDTKTALTKHNSHYA